ncbi:cryptochrome/deoxyribodipyrimidine photo-lyase family protein [Methylophilus sp. 14]|uniref:cryptochrome/deoxyribodipyrimidine photo-lyase family protein n=1 Tax=Methylophilus sp. 14 TaxID=2781019 RepID=UPI00188F0A2B|nr:FAD-binding domain-containing protein [Methylophilus sp. 14]MBF4986732.1 deoxyribodipyrimidine photo-lyase [Methylophilus sp. 14]
MALEPLHVVWFKRDLRVKDHAAFAAACAAGKVLPMFVWAPQVWAADDASFSQAMFVRECLQALAAALQTLGLQLHVYHHDPLLLLKRLHEKYGVAGLYSHEETGNDLTFQIDKQVQAWCRQQSIVWQEWAQNGVVRRLADRQQWQSQWERRMQQPLVALPAHCVGAQLPHHGLEQLPKVAGIEQSKRQIGGLGRAEAMMSGFLQQRVQRYQGGLSSPLSASQACSRLSPYLAWGALSLRMLVQATRASAQAAEHANLRRNLHGFESRLHWHCHFMQKLESEPGIEFDSFYPGFDALQGALADADRSVRLQAWQTGQTGWPLVDACMEMLNQTGWLNFRMRAMLMSTASYLLRLPWRQSGLHLARTFIDYEPGIHWPQVQMQSGTTGMNTLRIYHPVKQALVQDPTGRFVRQWLPALRAVPDSWIFEPWHMPAELQLRTGCVIGGDYPAPMVDIAAAMQLAKQDWFAVRQQIPPEDMQAMLQRHASRRSRHFPKVARGMRRKRDSIIVPQREIQLTLEL